MKQGMTDFGWRTGSGNRIRKPLAIEEAFRPITIREQDRVERVPVIQAILRKVAVAAAKKSGRLARLIEYDPAYCDVILGRHSRMSRPHAASPKPRIIGIETGLRRSSPGRKCDDWSRQHSELLSTDGTAESASGTATVRPQSAEGTGRGLEIRRFEARRLRLARRAKRTQDEAETDGYRGNVR